MSGNKQQINQNITPAKDDVSLFNVSGTARLSLDVINSKSSEIPLINEEELKTELVSLWKEGKDEQESLSLIIASLKEHLTRAKEETKEKFFKGEINGIDVVFSNSNMMDSIIRALMFLACNHTIENGKLAENMVISAVGGYGRRELAPLSDVDILFLLPSTHLPQFEEVAKFILYILWDIGIKVGQSFRTIEQCINEAQKDITIKTNLLEARYICGNKVLFDRFYIEYREKLVKNQDRDFVVAKLKERNQRYNKMERSRYLLEPDVKEGRGGLRDLHLIFWFAQFLYDVTDIKELINLGVLSEKAVETFIKAHGFFNAVRCYIHFISKKPANRLIFDLQPEIARLMGFADTNTSVAVEKFMKSYYLHAKLVGDLVRLVCALLEEINCGLPLLPADPKISGKVEVNGFAINRSRLNFKEEKQIKENPSDAIKIFRTAQKYNLDIHPKALNIISEHSDVVFTIQEDKNANDLFMQILMSKTNPERALRMMSEAGVLGRFIPDFGFVIAQMQYDMYHIYTTDEHTLTAIGILHSIEHNKHYDLAEYGKLPNMSFATEVFKKIENKKPLYFALFFHDVAKGRGGDHSEKGAIITKELAPRFNLTEEEADTASWLVKYHQIMSQTAFQRDVQDEKTIEDFSNLVKSPERLRLLYLLTCADILAVGPNVWSEWKATLIYQLYQQTMDLLSGGMMSELIGKRAENKKLEITEKLKNKISEEKLNEYLAVGFDSYWVTYSIETLERHAKLIFSKNKNDGWVNFDINIDEEKQITEVTVHTEDRIGIFSKIAGAIAITSLSIIDAKIITLKDGTIIDTFSVQDDPSSKIGEAISAPKAVKSDKKLKKLKENIKKSILNKINIEEEIDKKIKTYRSRIRMIKEPVRVIVNNEASNTHTVLEVNADDRLGLLYSITNAITKTDLHISSAHVSTYGTRAFDVFYIKDKTGMKITNKNKISQLKEELYKCL